MVGIFPNEAVMRNAHNVADPESVYRGLVIPLAGLLREPNGADGIQLRLVMSDLDPLDQGSDDVASAVLVYATRPVEPKVCLSYQRPYAMTAVTQLLCAIDWMRSGKAMRAFHAAQQASTMA